MTAAPPPVAHAPEPLPAEIVAEARAIARTFHPHPHWTLSDSPFAYANYGLIDIAIARLQGSVELSSEPIPLLRLDDRPTRPWPDPEDEIEQPVWARRGGSVLKDETWSALRYLQALHPGDALEPFWRCLPYGWLHAASRTFVTAGNLDPERALSFMLEYQVLNFGIAGPSGAPARGSVADKQPAVGSQSPLAMHWLRFGPGVLDAMQAKKDRELAELVQALRGH